MDLDEAITVTKINTQDGYYYLMIGWQVNSFEMYLYMKEKLWKGHFSSNRLVGFSRNLHMNEKDYFANLKRCLSEQRNDYRYELKSGFFYWKRLLKDSLIIEGFLPVELETSPTNMRPDLIEVLLALNKNLKEKVHTSKYVFKVIKKDYQKCLTDTKEFLRLKIEMETALCDKFMNLLTTKKSNIEDMKFNNIEYNQYNANKIIDHLKRLEEK